MPAQNMSGPLTVPANPSAGKFVLMSPFSGPKGSPFDKDQAGNNSTGALCTGIGINATRRINISTGTSPFTAPGAIKAAGFTDDYTPGVSMPCFPGTGFNGAPASATTAILTAIGGGKSVITPGPGNTGLGVSTVSPYAVQPLLGFGNGGSRDAGAGPAFTGFPVKMVTAAAGVAVGAVIETGFVNRGEAAMVTGDSEFGSSTTASAAIT